MTSENTRLYGIADDGNVLEIEGEVLSSPECRAQLDEVWPPQGLRRCEDAPRSPASSVQIDAHEGMVRLRVDGVDRPGGWNGLESALALFAAERLARLVAVHAAVFRWNGQLVIVPGASYSGKSTLAAAAASLGEQVASDEYALVDPDTGLVSGWPRPVRLRTTHGIERHEVIAPLSPSRCDVVAVVHHDPAVVQKREFRPLSQGATAMELLRNTVCARSRPAEAIAAAVVVAHSAQGFAGVRGEAREFLTSGPW